MRRVFYDQLGDPDVLHIEAVELPPPGPGEVRLGVRAIGLNRFEALMRRNAYVVPPTLPSAMGAEATGIVEAVGAGVTRFRPGDRVTSLPLSPVAGTGVYADAANVPETCLIPAVDGTSDPEEAALWCAYLTVWELLCARPLPPGATVLITAAASSVGIAAIQVARDMGLTSIATTRSRGKAAALLAAGAAHVIVTGEEDLQTRVADITAGRGVVLALDAVAGPGLAAVVASTAAGGSVALYGSLAEPSMSAARLDLPLTALFSKWISFRSIYDVLGNPKFMATAESYIRDGYARGALQPVIDRTFQLADISAAHAYLEEASQIGKIVVLP